MERCFSRYLQNKLVFVGQLPDVDNWLRKQLDKLKFGDLYGDR